MHSQELEVSEPVLFKLLDFMMLLDAGCPVRRHELIDEEWKLIGELFRERSKIAAEEAKENTDKK